MADNIEKHLDIIVDDMEFINDIKAIVYRGKEKAYQAADTYQVVSNWLVGRRIVEQEQHGKARAEYGKRVIELASKALTEEFGKGYSPSTLRNYRKFYLSFKGLQIQQAVLVEFQDCCENQQALLADSPASTVHEGNVCPMPQNLSWMHYERLMRVSNEIEREWYMREASAENWSYRTLDRNIGSQYYYRLLQTPELKRAEVISEMERLTADYQKDRHKFLRNPVVAEFLGFAQDSAYSETNLESAIIDHLQKFMLELGKGFAFVARQQRIKTDMGDYYIDLIFYNYILKCFLLIDLKTSQITYNDVGQMDMYIRMYDEKKCTEGDNPTIGLLLCSETSKDLARYSILKDSKQLYAAKYLTYLPTKEQLMAEIERQKDIFALQTGKNLD